MQLSSPVKKRKREKRRKEKARKEATTERLEKKLKLT
jgi:hypothetical protein